jgi:WD40 repeat protein
MIAYFSRSRHESKFQRVFNMQVIIKTLMLSLCFFLCGTEIVCAEQPALEYTKDIEPILAKYCAGCHNDTDHEADFSVSSFSKLSHGVKKGPVIIAGKPDESRLVKLITITDPLNTQKMPPVDEPAPTKEEIAKIIAWIKAGAAGPLESEPVEPQWKLPQVKSMTKTRPVTAMTIHPQGQAIAIGRYNEVDILDWKMGQDVAAQPLKKIISALDGKVSSLHFSHDGKILVIATGIAGYKGQVTLIDYPSGNIIQHTAQHLDLIYDAELSPNGKLLATSGYDKSLRLWDVSSGAMVRELAGHNGAVYDLDFSPNGEYLVSASADDTCKVWRVKDGLRLDTLPQPLKEVYSCLFSRDGNTILSGGADHYLRTWNFVSRSKVEINPLQIARFAHEGPILSMALSQNGDLLATTAEDKTVKLWDAHKIVELESWKLPQAMASFVVIAPDNQSVIVGDMNGKISQLKRINKSEQSAKVETAMTVEVHPVMNVVTATAVTEKEPNSTLKESQKVTLPAMITGTIDGAKSGGDNDLYQFTAKKGEEWVFEINASRNKSPLDSYLEILDDKGEPVERMKMQAVRDSYFTFRGKDDITSDDFRIFNWQDMKLDQYLYANGEVVKLWLYPRGADSGYIVYPGAGKRHGYFNTTPLTHALGEPCYVVQPLNPDAEVVPNGLPVFTLYYENDDESRRMFAKDSLLMFTAPRDGTYQVKVRDVRGFQGPDFKYTLAIRQRNYNYLPRLQKADLTVFAGSANEFTVQVKRLDEFDGPIQIDIDHLPSGFTTFSPLIIEPGQELVHGLLVASEDAVEPTKEQLAEIKMHASAKVDGREIQRDLTPFNKLTLKKSRKLEVDIQPLGNEPNFVWTPEREPLEVTIKRGQTISMQVIANRKGFDGNISFGKEDAGRNMPHGVYVDNIGLNGLLIPEKQTQREFFITADKIAVPQTRLFHLKADTEGGMTSFPVLLHIVP